MKNLSLFKFILIITITLAIAVTVIDGRGGRRGGSFGGIFGGWRKYKKHGSSGNGNHRRPVISGSPVAAGSPSQHHSASSSSLSSSSSTVKKTHVHHDNHHNDPPPPYPGTAGSSHHLSMHDPPPPYPGLSNAGFRPYSQQYYGGASGVPHLPPGGTYHANPTSIPQGAVYYAQPPVTSSGSNDYLFGLMVGHALSSNHRHHVRSHHHNTNNNNQQQNSEAAAQNKTSVTIIENGNGTTENYWPTDTVVPLAPFSTNIPPATAGIYQQPPPDAPAGIICVPMLIDETDSKDPTQIVQVEKTVCYPAPPPLPPNCVMRTFIEADPVSPTKTIEVQRQICNDDSDSHTTQPIQVAGEIGEETTHGKH